MNVLEKMKLTAELKQTVKIRNAESNPLKKLSLAKQVQDLRKKLGLIGNVPDTTSETLQEQNEIDPEKINTDLDFYREDDDESYLPAVNRALKTLQGKYINTVIGKVLFNAVSTSELSLGTKANSIRAKLIPFVPRTLASGKYLGREENIKDRSNKKGKFVAFHRFEGIAQIEQQNIRHLVRVGERENGEFVFIAYHSRALLDSIKGMATPDTVSTIVSGRSEVATPFGQDYTPILDDMQYDFWGIEILEITDLNGNPISLDDEPSRNEENEIVPETLDKNLNLPENPSRSDLGKAVSKWLKTHLQGKIIRTVDGKKVRFNSIKSTKHLAHDGRRSELAAKAVPYIYEVFSRGEFISREELIKDRVDFVAFHAYQKWVEIEQYRLLLEAKAGELENGTLEALPELVAYSQKIKEKIANNSFQSIENTINDSVQAGKCAISDVCKHKLILDNIQVHQKVIAMDGVKEKRGVFSRLSNQWIGMENESLKSYGLQRNNTLFLDDVQPGYALLTILAVTDLDGNPIDFGNEEILPVHMPDNQPPKAEMFNYNKEGESTPAKRQSANKKAIELVKMLLDGSLKKEDLTIEQKITLSEYSGNGGNMTDANGNKGSQYEYYTPKEIAGGMWELLKASGFTGGKVLDPCAGTGIFAATAPDGILMDNVELSEVSGTINKAIFENESHKTTISPFEAVAAATPDEQYDAVITNVPFGSNADRGGNQYKDSLYQDESLDHYFILRSLKKLRPNGLAVFMCATKVLTGTRYRKQRLMMSEMAEFIGAYRLPDHVFGSAGAGVVTDVLVFKKHGSETKARINDVLKEDKQGIKLLEKANVYWQPFISGKYYQSYPSNVLGSATQVKNRYGLVESIQSDATMAEIAKLMQKLGGSRIDWEMLQTQESGFITYQDGDTQYFDGVMKIYNNGKWENAELAENTENIVEQLQQRLSVYGSPLQIIEQRQPLEGLLEIVKTVQDRQISLQVLPDWLRVLMKQAQAA